MNRWLVVVAAGLVLPVGVAGGTHGLGQQPDPDLEPDIQGTEEFDRTIIEIEVYGNGSARWGLEQHVNIPIDDTERIEQFETFAEEFRTNETEAYENFQIRADRLIDQGTDATGREMNATAFRRDAYYQDRQQRGVVEMSFLWEGVAPVDGDQVTVADVLAGLDIFEDQRLEIRAGGDLGFQSVQPEPDIDRRSADGGEKWVAWRGPQSFGQELEVVLLPEDQITDPDDDDDDDGGTPTDDGATDADETGDETEGGGGGSAMLMPVLVAFVLVIGVGGGAVWYTLSRADRDEGRAGVESAGSPDAGAVQPDSVQEPVPESKLLSDEDRVIQLLEDNGGRMRQVTIVKETDWSKSKVSMLLSDMEEEGDISKLRVGRENIISLAGEEPEAAGSPFESEEE